MPPLVLSANAGGIARAAGLVRRGEVVAFPTDTVYGLMALPIAAERIYEAKRRPADKQLIAMASSLDALRPLVVVSPRAEAFAARWWPGPLTLVLPRPPGSTPPTLGVRVPDHAVALALLQAVGEPVLTTSANLSGEAPAMTAREVGLEGVAAVVDAGRAPGGVPSTVLSLAGPDAEVLREGAVPAFDLLIGEQAWKMRDFAERETSGRSRLYAEVCRALAEEPQALVPLLAAAAGQRKPNLLLAAVHALLLAGVRSPLAAYYPSCGGDRAPSAEAGERAVRFVLEHAGEVAELCRTRRTQTNEVGRCGALVLGLARVPGPIALVEVGASAGLLLNLDRYRYRYRPGGDLGPAESPLVIETEVEGEAPPLPDRPPAVADRVGLEHTPLDVTDPQTVLWLRALVWPDDLKRLRLLEGAVEVARRHPPRLVPGDAVDDLERVVRDVRSRGRVVVLESFVMGYLDADRRRRLPELCRELGVHRLSLEGVESGARNTAHLDLDGAPLALTGHHGGWLRWVGARAATL